MGIFGSSHSKFVSGSNTVELYNSILDPTYFVPNEIEYESVLNGNSTYNVKSNKASFTVTVYLFKYDDPKTKLQEILSYKNKSVEFYPSYDKSALHDLIGNPINFYVKNIQPFYLLRPNDYDAVNITFESEKSVAYNILTGLGYGYNYGMYYGYGL